MNIVEKKINEIRPYEHNPRLNDSAVRAVKNSIKEFGFKVPIVVDKDGIIICGHTRYKAAKELGMKTVPVVWADELNDEQAKAFRIADNKVGEKSEWDFDLLSEELADMKLDYDMIEFGFEKQELNLLLGEDDYDVQVPAKPSKQCNTNNKRIIIVYKKENIPFLKQLLHETGELKDSYNIKNVYKED